MERIIDPIRAMLDLGGPVVAILLVVSVISLATILLKFWQFARTGVGRRKKLEDALRLWDDGNDKAAIRSTEASRSHIRSLMLEAMEGARKGKAGQGLLERLSARAEAQMSGLESGFRLLDSIAQTAPLLGLFGTVLGMIDAFQSLEAAGSSVDPSRLAGGIWVALLTTAVGLGVAMPTALALTWLDGRLSRDRIFADKALTMLLMPESSVGAAGHAAAS
ncbi:MAG: MotA/TolQ/ExbB proton channel family protein [Pseudomonadota bacterium]